MKKKILLIMPSHYYINEMLIENFEKLNFEVTYIDSFQDFKYKNFFQRIVNFYHKTILSNRNYKVRLREEAQEKNFLFLLKNIPKNLFEFTLVIRPDLISPEVLSVLNKISKKTFAYQWDGMDRFHISDELIRGFDKFAMFDYQDYKEYRKKFDNVIFTDNFYFDTLQKPKEKTFDLVYFGSYQEEHFFKLEHLLKISEKSKNVHFQLCEVEKRKKNCLHYDQINITPEKLKYKELANISKKSKTVIDLKYPFHEGLSLRIFEALNMGQKVISNNQTIKKYDFYNENNFLIFDTIQDLNEKDLQNFLSKPYIEIPDEIKEKYSFTSWVHHLLKA